MAYPFLPRTSASPVRMESPCLPRWKSRKIYPRANPLSILKSRQTRKNKQPKPRPEAFVLSTLKRHQCLMQWLAIGHTSMLLYRHVVAIEWDWLSSAKDRESFLDLPVFFIVKPLIKFWKTFWLVYQQILNGVQSKLWLQIFQ